MMDTHYHFLSYGRQGLAAAIDSPLAAGQKRAAIGVDLTVARKSKAAGTWENAPDIHRTVELYGPGDIVGFDERIVVRTDPKPDSGNFETNFFPLVEFADFDFPWRFSPEPVSETQTLSPWIVLIALVAEDRGEDIHREYEAAQRGKDQVPVIRVFDQRNLPDLRYSWRWAHIQAASGEAVLSAERLSEIRTAQPEYLISRLLCPRLLQPQTLYSAFVVPAFKLGWAAGIGDNVTLNSVKDNTANDPAWDFLAGGPIDLPYYYRWNFRTSMRGDFEYLVRLLKPRALQDLGLRKLNCGFPGFGLSLSRPDTDEEDRHILDWEGALQSRGTQYTPWGKDRSAPPETQEQTFQQKLAGNVLNLADPKPLVRSFQVLPVADLHRMIDSGIRPPAADYDRDTVKRLISQVSESVSFELQPDGKSAGITWQTPIETTGSVSYGLEKASGLVTFNHISQSEVSTRHHRVVITLAPEKIYWLKLKVTCADIGFDQDLIKASLCISLPVVVPPIYGKWHAARPRVSAGTEDNAWLDVLNLDPRHRAAAGLGAEVVRRQQESLMASAWDQLGEIEKANDILRRAQLGRESCLFLYDRLGSMTLEDYLWVTNPVQSRILRGQADGTRRTVVSELEKSTLLPQAALDPAFRRISRTRGPLRKRQKQHRTDILRRLAAGQLRPAGEPPAIMGTESPCEITREMIQPAITFSNIKVDAIRLGASIRVTVSFDWVSRNTIGELEAAGDWEHINRPICGSITLMAVKELPLDEGPVIFTFGLTGESFAYSRTYWLDVVIENYSYTGTITTKIILRRGKPKPRISEDLLLRFCDERLTCDDLNRALQTGESGVYIHAKVLHAICETFTHFLIPEEQVESPPPRDQSYFESLRAAVHTALDPRKTILERVSRRLKLSGKAADRFREDFKGDPLDSIMAYPEFPQPMYEPLRDLSQAHILPGVESVPQNTVSILEPNRRFLESYMVGLNHEFSAELLWRGFPTDQQGSYFRQFWDVREVLGNLTDRSEEEQEDFKESLKDIRPLHEWGDSRLGENKPPPAGDENGQETMTVLVIRGDLLNRYPNAVVYAVDAREETDPDGNPTGNYLPDLQEFIPSAEEEGQSPDGSSASTAAEAEAADPILPIFRGSLGADLVFWGFPFSPEDAKSSSGSPGKYFILEERVTETRFGLDLPGTIVSSQDGAGITISGWDAITWGNFGLADNPGVYLDSSETAVTAANGEVWDSNTTAAMRAMITMQKPVRIAIHADQMIP
ncbi:MAG: hypothetical protein JXA25_17745 [Anaerolineales bacterium]|nr:hypothetical protein [Anaerolineales bacterium]